MSSKVANTEKKDKLIRLLKVRDEIEFDRENKHPESVKAIKEWKLFEALPFPERQSIFLQWERYYQSVKESPIYVLFLDQKEAASKGDWARVKDLAQQVKQMREEEVHITLPRPSSIDPWEFNFGWVKAYKDCEKMINDLKKELDVPSMEESRSVWQ